MPTTYNGDEFVSYNGGLVMTSISSFYASAYAQVTKPTIQGGIAAARTDTVPAAAENPPATDATKPLAQVALDARAALDAGYKKLGSTGNDYTTGKEWDNVVGLKDLDRRTLYAMASNQGGLFSEREMNQARMKMADLESAAMVAADPLDKDPAARFKASVDFLDDASPEEKSSLEWAQSRASAQWGYESLMKWAGRPAENVDTGNIVVNMFLSAWNELSATNDASQDVRNMPSWHKAIELWGLGNETGQSISWTWTL